jgi:hypothetical protein
VVGYAGHQPDDGRELRSGSARTDSACACRAGRGARALLQRVGGVRAERTWRVSAHPRLRDRPRGGRHRLVPDRGRRRLQPDPRDAGYPSPRPRCAAALDECDLRDRSRADTARSSDSCGVRHRHQRNARASQRRPLADGRAVRAGGGAEAGGFQQGAVPRSDSPWRWMCGSQSRARRCEAMGSGGRPSRIATGMDACSWLATART